MFVAFIFIELKFKIQTFLFSYFFDQTFSFFFSQMIVEFIVNFVQPTLKLILTHFWIQILIFEYVICQDNINSIPSNRFPNNRV